MGPLIARVNSRNTDLLNFARRYNVSVDQNELARKREKRIIILVRIIIKKKKKEAIVYILFRTYKTFGGGRILRIASFRQHCHTYISGCNNTQRPDARNEINSKLVTCLYCRGPPPADVAATGTTGEEYDRKEEIY